MADSEALPVLIETQDALARLSDELRGQPRIAVDTESNSLHAYQERVCLIQFSTVSRDYVVDPLALDSLHPLADIFSDGGIEKIFHAAEYDLICLRRDYDYSFANIFDTMHAGRILGRRQAGLDRLVEEKFGVKVNKRFQKADWGVRPIPLDLLLYAAQDTHYLIPLREMLEVELREKDLWQLAQEDFRMACVDNGQKARPESPAWARLSLRRGLAPRDLTVLKELVDCREEIAARLDRPPFKIVDDDLLVIIAQAKPSSLEDLKKAGLGARQLEHWGGRFLSAVASGLTRPLVQRAPPRAPSRAYLKRLDKLKAWRKKAAADMGVESDVVLPRPLLLELAESGLPEVGAVLAVSPWRLHHFGAQIEGILQSTAP